MLGKLKITRNPSPYPRVLFHAIRLAQFISCAIVTSILAFFVYYLKQDNYAIPWTFLVLLAVSAFTNISVFVTAFFYHYRTLKPGMSAVINTFLTALWFMGFSLLTWYLSKLLHGRCTIENWDNEVGVMVCRIYKALETFSIVGMLTTAGSLVLDLYVISKSGRRGVYNQMGDVKRSHPQHSEHDDFSTHLTAGDTQPFAGREASFEIAHPSFAHHDAHKPYKTQEPYDTRAFSGYTQPSQQTSYEGAGARLDRAFEREGA